VKTCPSAALSTTNPTSYPEANPGSRGGKPATNRLSYGTPFLSLCLPYNLNYKVCNQVVPKIHFKVMFCIFSGFKNFGQSDEMHTTRVTQP
jgi:hypothetical protein